jgi:hypothetical protein
MARPIPYLFCRYSMHVDDDLLDANATFEALNELQGQFLPHGATAERNNILSVVVMQPKRQTVGGEDVVTWAIGHRPGHRTVVGYDSQNQQIQSQIEADGHIVHTQIIAIPRLGALAVNDRVNDLYMGAKPALSRTRSALRKVPGGAFAFWFLQPGDVANIIGALDLLEYAYTVRRINPTPPSVLSAAFDASMAQEGIGIIRGSAKPLPGETMTANDGIIQATVDLSGAGYGVTGFKGVTDSGHLAQIRKPPFSLDKKENLRQQEKEQPLRVIFETEGDEADILAGVVAELVRFYTPNGASEIHQEPA